MPGATKNDAPNLRAQTREKRANARQAGAIGMVGFIELVQPVLTGIPAG